MPQPLLALLQTVSRPSSKVPSSQQGMQQWQLEELQLQIAGNCCSKSQRSPRIRRLKQRSSSRPTRPLLLLLLCSTRSPLRLQRGGGPVEQWRLEALQPEQHQPAAGSSCRGLQRSLRRLKPMQCCSVSLLIRCVPGKVECRMGSKLIHCSSKTLHGVPT